MISNGWQWGLGLVVIHRSLMDLRPFLDRVLNGWKWGEQARSLRSAASVLKTLGETLEGGVVPESSDWDRIRSFPAPWGSLIASGIRDLRDSGCPVLPTLKRMEETLLSQAEGLMDARARTTQALGQALTGMGLVPLFGWVLYRMMPGLGTESSGFLLLVAGGSVYASFSAVWILNLAEEARFGGLPVAQRQWLMSVPAALERILSLIAGGLPPDLAWRRQHEELSFRDPSLAALWGGDVWESGGADPGTRRESVPELVRCAGLEVKRTIQLALFEGRSSLDRIESISRSYQHDVRLRIRERLEALPNRCLPPLFIFVLPPVFILLGVALLQALREIES
jgi:hypothetical protein